jgi:broad specificity phosphatase PhoE
MKKEYTELRRRPLLTPVWLMAIAGVVLIAVVAWFLSSLSTTTVVIVRHAEKELGTIEDPPLSQAGEQRAQLLARMFGERETVGRIDAIFASDTRRSQRTAAPLADRLGVAITTVDAKDVEGLARRIRQSHRGQRVLVIGHSNTVPEIVRALDGGALVPPIGDDDYSQMYVVTIPTLGPTSVLHMNY